MASPANTGPAGPPTPEQIAAGMAAAIQGFKNVQGPVLLGVQLSLILLGILTCQFTSYVRQYMRKDQWATKTFVLVVYVSMLVKGALDMSTLYVQFIPAWGTPGSPLIPVETVGGISLACFILALCQLWLVHRVYFVSQRSLPPALVGLVLSLAASTLQITYAVMRIMHRDVRDPSFRGDPILRAWAFTAAGADVYLCFAFVFYALRQKKAAMSARLDSVLRDLTRLSLQACLPTASVALATAFAQLLRPHNGWFVMFQLSLPGLYVFSVLYTLNARDRIATQAATATGEGEGASNFKSSIFSPGSPSTDTGYRGRMNSWASTFTRRDSKSVEYAEPKEPAIAAGISYQVDVDQRVDRLRSLEPVAESPTPEKEKDTEGDSSVMEGRDRLKSKAHLWNRWEDSSKHV